MNRIPPAVLALVPLALALTAGGARADEPAARLDGRSLARSIEAQTDEAARRGLIDQAARLRGEAADQFVGWAAAKWKDGGWEHLAPALAKIDVQASVELLMQVAREAPMTPVGCAASVALGHVRPGRVFSLVWPAWVADHGTFNDALVGCLASRPTEGLALLQGRVQEVAQELDWLPADDDRRGELLALLDDVTEVVSSSLTATDQPLELLAGVDASSAHPCVVRGITRGIDARVPSRAALAQERRRALEEQGADPALPVDVDYSSELQAERQHYAPVLIACALRGDPRLAVEAFGVLPLVLDVLTEDVAPVLLEAIESADRQLSAAAFTCLRRISGEDLPQTRNAWERWWTSTKEVARD